MSLIYLKDADEIERAMCMSLRLPRNPERYAAMVEASTVRHNDFLENVPAKQIETQPGPEPQANPEPTKADVVESYAVKHEVLPWVMIPDHEIPKQKGELIIDEVCEQRELPVAMVIGHVRSGPLVHARQEIMYRMTVELGYSTVMVAKMMNRDHSTVVYGRQKHAKRNGLPMNWNTNALSTFHSKQRTRHEDQPPPQLAALRRKV